MKANDNSILLTGNAVNRARRIVELQQELDDRHRAIEERANAELAAVQDALVSEALAEFEAILSQYKIPPADAPVWRLIPTFLASHDIAFLVMDEQEAIEKAFIHQRLNKETLN